MAKTLTISRVALIVLCLIQISIADENALTGTLDPDGARAADDIKAKCETTTPDFMSDKPRKEKQKEFSKHAACVKTNFGASIMKRAEYEKAKLKKNICLTNKQLDKMQEESGMGTLEFYATHRRAKEMADQNKQARIKYQRLYGIWLIGDSKDCNPPEFRQQLYDLAITDFYCFSADFYAPLENRKPACPWKK